MPLTSTKFHLSLNVSHLMRSVEFYRFLFGLEPAKLHDDYAKFELLEPPVVFSLVPQPALTGGSLSRIGLRLADADAVAEVKQRLEGAGLPTQTPPGTGPQPSRCYVADPDLNYWEISSDDAPGTPVPPPRPVVAAVPLNLAAGPVVWEHALMNPPPERIPHPDDSVDEVRLTGTFNATLDEEQRARLLREAWRVLRPGGKVVVHGLVGDRPLDRQPQLPGLAALVQRVPVQTEPPAALRAAGFQGVQFTKFREKAWFEIDGVEMREVKLIAFKPAETAETEGRQVIFKGPFREATDDAGHVYPRGRRVTVRAAAAALLQQGAAAEQFLVLQPGAGCCSIAKSCG